LAVSQLARLRADFGLLLVIFLTFAPTTTGLLIGQDSTVMLLVYSLVFVLLKRGSHVAAGCALACGLVKFHLVLPFVVLLLLRRKWQTLAGFAGVACAFMLVSVAVSGPAVLMAYPRVLFFSDASRQMMGFHPDFTPNIHGFLYLIAKTRLAARALPFLVGLISLFVIAWAARAWKDDRLAFSFSAAVLATLLTSYHLYNYDLVLLLLPVSIVCGELAERGRLLDGSKFLTVVLSILFLPPVHFVLVSRGMYALMFLPIATLFLLVIRRVPCDLPTPAATEA